MSLRDPSDAREMPPNGVKFVNAWCVRGVRKIEPERYLSLVRACEPDIVFVLSDIPFTPPPFSQKRIEKSLQRSVAWLASHLQPAAGVYVSPDRHHPLNLVVHMVGDVSEPARAAFAASLAETLYGKDAEKIAPYKCLDDAIFAYSVDLVPLRASILAQHANLPSVDVDDKNELPANRRMVDTKFLTCPRSAEILPTAIALIHASLADLPHTKPRIVTGAASPHEALALIRAVGIDLFDAGWAQKAADWGVALDFIFPAPLAPESLRRKDSTRDLGHNLYEPRYARDFTRFAECLADGASGSAGSIPTCPCIACSPRAAPAHPLSHAAIDARTLLPSAPDAMYDPPHTRAYVHHLLHTHEMSAHTLIASHNLAVAEHFFASVRRALADSAEDAESRFAAEVDRFCATYDGTLRVFAEAKRDWIAIDYARGKGRLAREKAKQGEENLTTKTEVEAEVDEAAVE